MSAVERAWRHFLAISGIALLLAAAAAAQTIESAPEQSIKAAYLYNFAAYIDWPGVSFAGSGAPLVIGILGDDAVAGELEHITRDRQVRGRPVQVRRLEPGDPITGLHMLFVSQGRIEALPKLAREAQAGSVVIVTESGDALRLGSMINFLIVDERVRFEVSLEAAHASGLTVSSRLLTVAERVLPRIGQ